MVVRANTDGSIVRVNDVARIELGMSLQQQAGLNGKPSALVALYQMPGTNAVDAAKGARQLMEDLKRRFRRIWIMSSPSTPPWRSPRVSRRSSIPCSRPWCW